MKIFELMENEINNYLTGTVEISEGFRFSQYKIIKRIVLYANQIFPKGKIDKQGNYKYWTDVTQPRIDSEVKNIDFDTKDILYYSEAEKDAAYMILCNLSNKEWLRNNNQAEELNDAIEEFSGWGNVVWEKIKGGYERSDLKNFYVINQQAKTLDDTPVIKRHIYTQSDLRSKAGTWKQVDEVIKSCGNRGFTPTPQGSVENKETPYYEIYQRDGEISEQALNEAQGKPGGDENKFILARVIVAGLKKGEKGGRYILYADKLPGKMSDWYKEAHRGRYNGTWWRPGLIQLMFDIQTRSNEISNQIALGLEWASKVLFSGEDKLIANNIMTDLKNGDYIRGKDIKQIEVRIQGLDQLIADWNRLQMAADKICNSYEIVNGETPAGTPFKLANLSDQNATKLFDFLREKISNALQSVFEDWIMPAQLKNLKAKDVLRLTGDSDLMQSYYMMVVNAWYIKNLIAIGPHTPEMAQALKEKKMQEIMSKKEQFVKLEDEWLDGVKPRISVVISGENVNLRRELETLGNFIALEADPVRRTALIEKAMKRSGVDVSTLPKTPPQQMVQQPPQREQKEKVTKEQ